MNGVRLAYNSFEPDETVCALAKELVNAIIAANISYKKSIEALDCAQRLIETETKPVIS